MGEGEGGGGQDEDLLIPPPFIFCHRGEISGGICLINYGLLIKCVFSDDASESTVALKVAT
jgi:hypothetical protein